MNFRKPIAFTDFLIGSFSYLRFLFIFRQNFKVMLPKKVNTSFNAATRAKRAQKKFHVPIIARFADKDVEFSSILQAEAATGIPYTLIFEACVGKIYQAKNVIFEFKKGNHYIKYKARYINAQAGSFNRKTGFNG
jgi:hypothetical protein